MRCGRALMGVAIAIGLGWQAEPAQAGPPPARIQEDFTSDPLAHGWQIAGDDSLFQWAAGAGELAVTWDSARPNSFFYRRLDTYLTRDDDFRLEFQITLDELGVGTTPGKPFTFQIALGLVDLAQATGPGFLRGTGVDSPNLVEWDYFADSGFGATVAAALVSQTNAWATSFNWPVELQLGSAYRFVLDYQAANQEMTFAMSGDGAPPTLETARIRDPFGDFAVDALAICSYSDAGQDPSFAGSIRAQGRVDELVLELPPPPVRRFRGRFVGGVWVVELTGWLGWRYALEASSDLREWRPVLDPIDGTGQRQTLSDLDPKPDRSFYRVRAEPR